MKGIILVAALLIATTNGGFAADDPSIQGKTRVSVGEAMKQHIVQNTVKDRYVIYDAITGKLKRLEFEKLHAGIVKKGEFYVSCADFVDADGEKYDLDFLVAEKGYNFHVLQALVHKVGAEKRKYHVEEAP